MLSRKNSARAYPIAYRQRSKVRFLSLPALRAAGRSQRGQPLQLPCRRVVSRSHTSEYARRVHRQGRNVRRAVPALQQPRPHGEAALRGAQRHTVVQDTRGGQKGLRRTGSVLRLVASRGRAHTQTDRRKRRARHRARGQTVPPRSRNKSRRRANDKFLRVCRAYRGFGRAPAQSAAPAARRRPVDIPLAAVQRRQLRQDARRSRSRSAQFVRLRTGRRDYRPSTGAARSG